MCPATMASEAGPAVDCHPARQVGNPEPTVVRRSSQLAGRWPNLGATNGDLRVHRCVTDGLGSPWGGPDSEEWAMVQSRHRPYQCARAQSDISDVCQWASIPLLRDKKVLVRSDNVITVQYINRQGGTISPRLCHLTVMLWQIAVDNGIWLSAAHIKGETNVIVDSISKGRGIPWSLCPKVMSQIFSVYGTP